MNFSPNSERFRVDANLQGWSDYCRDVQAKDLRKTILHVCQAVYEVLGEGRPPRIDVKRKVFDSVANGDCSSAVMAMLPSHAETSIEHLPGGKVFAQLAHAQTGLCVAAEGNMAESALLGCLIELSLRADPAERAALLN